MGATFGAVQRDLGHDSAKKTSDDEPLKQPQPGSVFVPRDGEREAGEQGGIYRFQMLADRSARWSEARFWKELRIGHSWIRLMAPEGSVDSWGYWPDLWGGHAVDPKHPWRSVPGKVLHPDTQHAPNAVKTYEIDARAAARVEKAANAKEASPGDYNLFSYNCTTFVCEMAGVAGVPVPSASTLGIKNPNDLFAEIEELNAREGLDPMEHRVEPSPPPPQ